MKLYKYLFAAGALALVSAGFASCSDDDEYDFPGDPYNRVYARDYSTSASVVQIPGATIGGLSLKIPASCNQKAESPITVTFIVDPALVAEYNAENGTEYLEFPMEALVMNNQTVTIPVGAVESEESFELSFTDDPDLLATIDNEQGYVIPVRIESIEGGMAASSLKSRSYVVVDVKHTVLDPDARESNRLGTLVEDRSGWTVNVVQGEADGNLASWFDGDNTNHASVTNDDTAIAIVDLGKQYKFDGICASYYYIYWGNYGYDEDSFDNTTVYVSADGNEWVKVGTIAEGRYNTASFAGFYGPLTARYIRIEQPATTDWYGNSSATFDCGNFNIYALN